MGLPVTTHKNIAYSLINLIHQALALFYWVNAIGCV
jgi:hypothetical protein